MLHQPDVCELAAFLASRYGADLIINVRFSHGRVRSPAALDGYVQPTWHGRSMLESTRRTVSRDSWIEVDLADTDGTTVPYLVLRRSIVVCANLLEQRPDPTNVLQRLAGMSRVAVATIITTADRDAILRNGGPTLQPGSFATPTWNLPEFEDVLKRHGMNPTFTGLTVNSRDDLAKGTIAAIVDQCPVNSGRSVPADFRPLALMATYNEIDIAPQTVSTLLDDGVDVHVCDNWSTDGTFDALTDLARAKSGLSVARYPEHGPSQHFDYLGVLRWKEEASAAHPDRWIVSADSDEVRCSPWPDVSFRGGLYLCDLMGFTAVDFTVLNFAATDERFAKGSDPERTLRYFEFGQLHSYFLQVRAWRQGAAPVELQETGGHEARFEGQRVFPYKFLLKHYPLRNSRQARRKIFTDRRPRYAPETRAMGWHVQYDHLKPEESLLRAPAELIEFDDVRTRQEHLVELVTGIGVVRSAPPQSAPPVPLPTTECPTAELDALKWRISQLNANREALQTEVDRRSQEARELVDALRAKSEQAERLRELLDSTTEAFEEIVESTTWKITRPLRWAFGTARALGRSPSNLATETRPLGVEAVGTGSPLASETDIRGHDLMRRTIEQGGVRIDLDFSATLTSHHAWVGMIDAGWERGVFDFLEEQLGERDVFFDIGASVGPYAILAASKVGPSGRVVAIEPDPLAFSLLRHNLDLNRCDRVKTLQRALHDADGPVGLRRREEWGDSLTRIVPVADAPDYLVEGVTLSSLCRDLKMQPTVLKIDIEGGERVLLDQDTWAIVTAARAVVLEVHTEALGSALEALQAQISRAASAGLIKCREIGRRSEHNYNVGWVRSDQSTV